MGPQCQSCGMPMSKDKNGGGTEADGSRSTTYCSLCYDQGAFRLPDMSATEFQAFCVEKLREQGMPKIMAWVFTRGIPKLDRWSAPQGG